jgi:spore coat polysaccharide biosynthesis protein SpsF (cytidylyltransferase family)
MPFTFLIPFDDPLKEALKDRGVPYFEGPEEDVLKRYMLAMDRYDLTWCIRVTGDCPLVSPQDIFWMGSVCAGAQVDFGSNALHAPTDGQEVEFISRRMMEYMHTHAIGDEREHVTKHAVVNEAKLSGNFRYYSAPVQYGWQASPKLSVDTPDDLERVDLLMKATEYRA